MQEGLCIVCRVGSCAVQIDRTGKLRRFAHANPMIEASEVAPSR